MSVTCIECGKKIEAGDYRLIGVERGTWASRYAHRGTCEQEARQRFAPPPPKKRKRRKPEPPPVEELTLDDDTVGPAEDDALPWFGTERRR